MNVLTLENRMVGHINFNEKISSRSSVDTRLALIAYPYALSVINSRRHCHFDLLAAGCIACARTFGALLFDNFTRSAAVRTGLYILNSSEERLRSVDYLTPAAALRACFRRCSRFRACSVTILTWIFQNQIQFFFTSEHRFFKSNSYAFSYIGAFHRSVSGAPASSASSKQVTEYITEYVAEISSIKIKSTKSAGSSCSAFKCCVAELVILAAFFRITQDGIRF